jgi:hypothetical protein
MPRIHAGLIMRAIMCTFDVILVCVKEVIDTLVHKTPREACSNKIENVMPPYFAFLLNLQGLKHRLKKNHQSVILHLLSYKSTPKAPEDHVTNSECPPRN